MTTSSATQRDVTVAEETLMVYSSLNAVVVAVRAHTHSPLDKSGQWHTTESKLRRRSASTA